MIEQDALVTQIKPALVSADQIPSGSTCNPAIDARNGIIYNEVTTDKIVSNSMPIVTLTRKDIRPGLMFCHRVEREDEIGFYLVWDVESSDSWQKFGGYHFFPKEDLDLSAAHVNAYINKLRKKWESLSTYPSYFIGAMETYVQLLFVEKEIDEWLATRDATDADCSPTQH